MIINNNAVKIDSNVEPSKALNFGISDVRLVVDILSKLYAHPIQTLVQEYICNGRDAMREAGTWGKQPIVIQVPNSLDPVFKVRDFGVGITPDRMENVFVNYGSSTKRNTNTQTGGFGIGAKSAFSYTDSFGVTSFVDGVRYVYMAHLGDQGGVVLIEKSATKEPNGVEISIGVKPKDIHEFYNAVQRCVRFWSEPIKFVGTNTIVQEKPMTTLGDMSIYKGESRTIFLVDGIEYPTLRDAESFYRSRDYELHSSGHVVAIHVPNGFFKIASSRERLENNDDNKQKQSSMFNRQTKYVEFIRDKLTNEKETLSERISTKNTYSGLSGINGVMIPLGNGLHFSGNYLRWDKEYFTIRKVRRGRRGSVHYEVDSVDRFNVSQVTLFKSSEPDNITARKLNYWLSQRVGADDILLSVEQANLIPCHETIFTKEVLDVSTLPIPSKATSTKPKKTAREAIAKRLRSDKSVSHHKIHDLNRANNWVTIVESESDIDWELVALTTVYMVPKQNLDLITIPTKTVEETKKFLLSQNRANALGISYFSDRVKQLPCFKKFCTRKIQSDLYAYLVKIDPSIKAHNDALQKEYDSIVAKYPLIKVLTDVYSKESQDILLKEITKQMKEDK